MQLFKKYNVLLKAYPITTKTITSAILFGAGDGICQIFLEKKKKFDWQRCGNFMVFGGITGPLLHYWYGFLTNLGAKPFLSKAPKFAGTLLQVTLDQTLCSPLFLLLFYGTIGGLEGKSKEEIKELIKDKYWLTLKVNWMIWPGAQIINFYFVPPQMRVLWANFISLFFTVALSYIKNSYTTK